MELQRRQLGSETPENRIINKKSVKALGEAFQENEQRGDEQYPTK
jgi:hypothetical protein